MKTADFNGELTPNGQIIVPPEIAAQVPRGETIQVVLHWGASDEDAAWLSAGRRQFAARPQNVDRVREIPQRLVGHD